MAAPMDRVSSWPQWPRFSRGMSRVRRRGCTSPAAWNRLLLRPWKNTGSTGTPALRAMAATPRCQGGSTTMRFFRARLETSPAGKAMSAPPFFSQPREDRSPAMLRAAEPLPPKGSSSMSRGRISGMVASRWLARIFTSGRNSRRMRARTRPSTTPKGWLETMSSGPWRGMFRRSSWDTLKPTASSSRARMRKSGLPSGLAGLALAWAYMVFRVPRRRIFFRGFCRAE